MTELGQALERQLVGQFVRHQKLLPGDIGWTWLAGDLAG